MSDYFGALMRSSGMTIGGHRPVAAPRPSVEPSVVTIDVDPISPTAYALDMQTAAARPPAVASQSLAHLLQQPGTPAPEATTSSTPLARASESAVDHPLQPDVRVAADASAAGSPPAPSAALVKSPEPAQGEALVRAAMQWVAAGPQRAGGQGPTALSRGDASLDVTEVTGPIGATLSRGLRAAAPAARAPIALPQERTKPERMSPRVSNSLRDPVVGPARTTQSPPAAPALLSHDEVVEISIGAIHVRVDAPGTQTVARQAPAPSPVPAQRAADTPLPRSALLRRALRRI